MNVGELIKRERLAKGLTQEELADRVGVKKSAVAKWENGRVSEIKRSNLKNIADALQIDPNLLLGNQESVQEKPAINDGLTEGQRKLIAFAKTVPADKVDLILQVMQTIVEADWPPCLPVQVSGSLCRKLVCQLRSWSCCPFIGE